MVKWIRKVSFLLVTLSILLSKPCLASGLESSEDDDDSDGNEWWETTLVYQIWPRAYQDSDGDGEGDLQGIISRLDYLEDIGVETICLNPIYRSPLVDSGYDVADYKDVHPMFGSLDDFDELIQDIHKRDMKIILDVVPNHSSDQHEWFNYSVNRIEPYTDYYVWTNGTLLDNETEFPPNNWVSAWGDSNESAWTWNDQRDQWYYHKFHESQPDLNLDNPDVREDLMLILEFWLNRGVDGFRISGIPYFFEDPDLRDEPDLSEPEYTFGLERNVELLYDIRAFVDDWTVVNNSTSKLLVAGSYDTETNALSYYGRENTSGILPFNYRFIMDIDFVDGNASQIEMKIEEWLDSIPSNASTNWVLSNHDYSRVASRVGWNRLDALHMLSMLLPGQAFTYYGDEIGMLDTPIPWNETIDTMYAGSVNEEDDEYAKHTRDSVRTPMQWDDTNSCGFSANESTYLPVNDDCFATNVEEQIQDPRSHLRIYKNLARLRKNPVFVKGNWELEAINDDAVLVLRRTLTDHPVYLVLINLSSDEQRVDITDLYPDLDDYLEVVVASGDHVANGSSVSRDDAGLLPDVGLVLRSGNSPDSGAESPLETTTVLEETETEDDEDTESTTEASTSSSEDTTVASTSNETSTTSESTIDEPISDTTTESIIVSSASGPSFSCRLATGISLAIVIRAKNW